IKFPNERYENFLRQHVIDDMDINDCETVIEQRNIMDKNKMKKETNTFIVDKKDNVTPVCQNGTPICGNLMKSEGIFDTVVCKLKGNINDRPCRYDSSNKRQHIVIACDGGKPVHLEDSRRS
uniref:Ribonuclease A-domain domain-containing protein n=1 Tax=Poecilia reticulata TaxID=8081 RepID=A0A3P9PAM9_POERE